MSMSLLLILLLLLVIAGIVALFSPKFRRGSRVRSLLLSLLVLVLLLFLFWMAMMVFIVGPSMKG